MRGHESWVTSVAFSPDGKRIVSGNGGKLLKIWDSETGKELLTLRRHSGRTILSVAFSLDGKSILAGSNDGTVKIWNSK